MRHTARIIKDLTTAAHGRGVLVYLDPETGAAGLEPAELLTAEERHTLRRYLPELAAVLHGLVWHERVERLRNHYKLWGGMGWVNLSKKTTQAALERFEAKHGPLVLDLPEALRNYAHQHGDLEDLMSLGYAFAKDKIEPLSMERAEQSARVRDGMTRLLGIGDGFERFKVHDLDTTDPALLAMLADLDPGETF